MPPKQKAKKSCFICLRSIENEHLLGPLITTKTITAHFLCVLFNPVTPDADDFAAPEKDGGICGLSARYIREQAGRAAKLVYVNFLALHIFFFKFTLTLFRRSATFARETALTRAVVSTSAPTIRRNTVQRRTTSTAATKAGQASTYLKVVVLSPFVSIIATKSRGKFHHRKLIVTE